MIKAVIFDFDGVIVDSNDATNAYLKETLRHFKLPVPDDEVFKGLFGYKIPDILKTLAPDLSHEEMESLLAYAKIMSRKATPSIQLIPDAVDVLRLVNQKYKVALVTTRSKETVEILIEMYALAAFFEIVVDREEVTRHKPNPDGIQAVLRQFHLQPSEAIYIGDAAVDVETAHNANLKCILISPEDDNFGADFHIAKISELPQLINTTVEQDF